MELNMSELTLYEIMGEDHDITVKLHDDRHVEVVVRNEHLDILYDEVSHIYAWESLVYFAKQVVAVDARLQEDLKLMEE